MKASDLAFIGMVLFNVVLFVGTIWVIIHFVSKFW